MSDTYSFWDKPVNELTKGEGGMCQLHNYVTLEQSYAIPTPSDNYNPDKIGKNRSKSGNNMLLNYSSVYKKLKCILYSSVT